MDFLSYMIWSTNPDMFIFPDWFPYIAGRPVRWYGLLFALGFLVSQQIMFFIYRKEGKPEKDVETLTIFMVIATILGARLGHVFFYEPDKYLANPIDIIKIWEGGLASHGAAFGILFALWLYTRYEITTKWWYVIPIGIKAKRVKRPNQNWLQVVDRIVIVVALTGCLIRTGNFMNSEIYGIPTGSDYGVVFARNLKNPPFLADSSPIEEIEATKDESRELTDGKVPLTLKVKFKNQPDVLTRESLDRYMSSRFAGLLSGGRYYVNDHITAPGTLNYQLTQNSDGSFSATVNAHGISRYPTQLYEASTCLLIFTLLYVLWWRMKIKTPDGLLLGLFLILLFGLRFVHELFKENQVAFEDELSYNMGQLLSIPLILAGVYIFFRAITLNKKAEREI
ncbi:MAG: prolipoprotein diacylglyceryl transferase [Bacteroidota bacterium]